MRFLFGPAECLTPTLSRRIAAGSETASQGGLQGRLRPRPPSEAEPPRHGEAVDSDGGPTNTTNVPTRGVRVFRGGSWLKREIIRAVGCVPSAVASIEVA